MHFLDAVQLAYSCPLAWEKLTGSDAKRFCGSCSKHVTNLSAMSRPQAEAFLAENASAPICVRVEVDAMGRAVHRPALTAPFLMAASLAAAACDAGTDSALDSGSIDMNRAAAQRSAQHDAPIAERPTHTIAELDATPVIAEVPAPVLRTQAIMGRRPSPPIVEPTYQMLGEPAVMMGAPVPIEVPPHRPLMGKPAVRPVEK